MKLGHKMRINEIKNRYIKYILSDTQLKGVSRLKIQNNKNNKTKLLTQRHCVLTQRTRSVFKKYKISRIILRKLALNGEIPGLIKKT